MEKYYQFVMRLDNHPKPIVIGTSEQITIYELMRFYRPELLDEEYKCIEIPEWAIDTYLKLNGEDSIEFI